MKRMLTRFFLMVLVCFTVNAQALQLHVATDGNDAWSGTLAKPNAAGTDGPLATISGARDVLRKGHPAESIVVIVHGGNYFVTEPMVFEPQDSGTAEHPIVYRAAKGEAPVIHGGRVVERWKKEGDLWVADIPAVREGSWAFSSLWGNGERRQPARTPNPAHPWGDSPPDSDFFRTAAPVMVTDAKTGKSVKSSTQFEYNEGDIQDWASLDDAVFVTFHSWATSLTRMKSIDREKKIIEFTGPARWTYGNWQPDQRYFIEYLFEALDQPGEWYLNKKTGKLYYSPMADETLGKVEVVAPVAQQLLQLTGKPETGSYVEYLHFEGLNFQYTEYGIAPEGHSDAQSAYKVHAAVETLGARQCRFENLSIAHLGNYGFWFHRGSQHNVLRHCEIGDLGAGGVRLGEGGSPATPAEATEYNVVDNNFIHEGGRIFRSAVGVWIGRSSHNDITHNEISDFRYTGVSVGWSWGYAASSAHHNRINDNHIHHIGKGQLNDMGGIYCLGISPGTELKGNVIHDVISHPRLYGGWGLYTDEGSTGIVMENNLVYNTTTGGFHQHYGRDNIVRNNILAYSHGPQIIRSREEEHNSFTFENNIVYFNTGKPLGSTWKNGNWVMDNNIYWDTTGQEMDFSGGSFEEWQARGNDAHSLIADPGFVSGETGNFQLKPDSAALSVGFKPFDFSKAGLYGNADWVAKPKARKRPAFTPPPVPEPRRIADGFEETAVGSVASGAQSHEEGAGRVRVSDAASMTGKRSLKFSDAPGLEKSFNPHLSYTPALRYGNIVGEFSIRLEPGAMFYHEWRDNRSPYKVGPSLWFRDGKLVVGGKALCDIPADTWVKVRIECALGKKADGSYAIAVTLPNNDLKRFEGVIFGTPDFKRLDWYGFVSDAQTTVNVYIDDLSLEAH